MTRERTKQNYLKIKNVAAHLESQYKRMWAHFVETGTESYYLLEGKKVTPEEMDVLYPIVALKRSGENKGKALDGRSNWIE